jgi:aspartate aminotransferase
VPQASIYLTIKFDLAGKTKPDGTVLADQAAVTQYLLEAAGLAIVPFYAFGAERSSAWYRLSVGTCRKEDIEPMFEKLDSALRALT